MSLSCPLLVDGRWELSASLEIQSERGTDGYLRASLQRHGKAAI